jgi:hypothetical protein
LCERARVNTTLTSFDISMNGLREGGGWSLAETLRLNTTVKSINISMNGKAEGGR